MPGTGQYLHACPGTHLVACGTDQYLVVLPGTAQYLKAVPGTDLSELSGRCRDVPGTEYALSVREPRKYSLPATGCTHS